MKNNLLITGGSGFIGKNLKEYIRKKYKVFAPSHQELDLLKGDKVRDYIVRNRITLIIHGANVGGGRDTVHQKDVIGTNLRMFFNIVRCEDLVERIIHFGSGAEYDKSRDLKKVSEEDFDKRVPKDDYGFYKYVCAKYILSLRGAERRGNLSRMQGILKQVERSIDSPVKGGFARDDYKIVCLRLFGVYGKYENYLFKFISNSIVRNLLHQPIVIGQNVNFDYLYITDLCRIVEHFLEKEGKYKDYNAVSGQKVDLLTVAKIINGISEYQSEIVIKNKGLNFEYTSDNIRLKGEIRDLKFTGITDGITKLYQWYKIHLKEIDKKAVLEDPYIKNIKVIK